MKLLQRLVGSLPVQIILTRAAYAFYAAVLGVSLVPSTFAALLAFLRFVAPALREHGLSVLGGVIPFSLCVAGSLFLFFFFGLLVMGIVMRVLSLGVKPGTYRGAARVTFFWMLEGGAFNLIWRLLLAFVPMPFVSQMFYRLAGCRLGRNVWITTLQLNDPYLVSVGDNTVIGGDRSLIGLRAFIRRGTKLPPGSRIISPAGLPPERVYEIERRRPPRTGRRSS